MGQSISETAIQTRSKATTGAENVRWDLGELFSSVDDPRIDEVLQQGTADAEKFVEQYKGKLARLSAAGLRTAFETLEAFLAPLYRLHQYSHLIYSVDTADDAAKQLMARVEEETSQIFNLLVFFDLELGAMAETDFAKFTGAPELTPYAYYLERIRKTARYNLSEKEEQLINLKDLAGVKAMRKLYTELTASFQFDFELDGEVKTLNGSELRALRQHPDRHVRRRAMKLFLDRYAENELVTTHLYNNIVKDFNIEKKLRGYASPISIMNVHNDLPDEVVETLHQVTTESYPLVQQYYKLKARILGLDDMTLADIYAPLPESSRTYTWNEAKALVLDAFRSFDAELYQKVQNMFDENRIDAPTAPKKQGGAYCSSATPDMKPYVMMNFTGKLRDVSTMAHELGHAIHAMFSSRQPLLNYRPILPLAETASVFSEMLLTDLFLKRETDNLAKQALLTYKLEDLFATSHRQNMFSRFEIGAHQIIAERLATSTELCDLYHEELRRMFGDSVCYTDEYRWEWTAVPHIYRVPFYVYAYNFGNLLVLSLYQQYLEEGQAFIPRYKRFLAMGSGADPTTIAGIVQADITDPDFWRKSLKYMAFLIDELTGLVEVQGNGHNSMA